MNQDQTSPAGARRHSCNARSILLTMSAAWAITGPALAQRYELVFYEQRGDFYFIEVNDLNNNGEMVGTAYTDPFQQLAVLWHADGRVVELPFLPPTPRTAYERYYRDAAAYDINDFGQIVGWSDDVNDPQRAALWPNEHEVVDLIGRDSQAYLINELGTVAGIYQVGFLDYDPFVWQNGQWQSLYPPMDAIGDLNNHDQIVGGISTAMVWDNGQFSSLPPLRPNAHASAGVINDNGLIGGWSQYDDDVFHPTYWLNGRPHELPSLETNHNSSISSINDRGEMIGTGVVHPGYSYPVLYRNNLTMRLNDLLAGPDAEDWRVSVRRRLNDLGQIGVRAAYLPDPYVSSAVRLDPVDVGLTLWGIEPSLPGQRNTIQINHVTPGGRVSLLWGTQRSDPQPLIQCGDAMIDILDPRLAGTATAGPDGIAYLHVNVPANTDGLFILQAVDHTTCEVSPPAMTLFRVE